MSFSYRLPHLALIGIALAGAVHAQLVSDDPRSQARPSQTEAKPQSDETSRILDTVNRGVERVSRALEAPKSEPNSAEEEDRAKRDLLAQELMAYWAKWMFWAAGASVVLTALGVVLIAGTLIYTKRAAEAAGEMVVEAKAATKAAQDTVEEARKATKFSQITADAAREALAITDRGWIQISAELTGPLVFDAEEITIDVRFVFRNIGKAPATSIKPTRSLSPDVWTAGQLAAELVKVPRLPMGWAGLGNAIFPGDSHDEEVTLQLPADKFAARIVERNKIGMESNTPYSVTKLCPCILVGVDYVLPGDRTYRFTYIPLEIRSVHPALAEGWDGTTRVVRKEELTLRSISGLVK